MLPKTSTSSVKPPNGLKCNIGHQNSFGCFYCRISLQSSCHIYEMSIFDAQKESDRIDIKTLFALGWFKKTGRNSEAPCFVVPKPPRRTLYAHLYSDQRDLKHVRAIPTNPGLIQKHFPHITESKCIGLFCSDRFEVSIRMTSEFSYDQPTTSKSLLPEKEMIFLRTSSIFPFRLCE